VVVWVWGGGEGLFCGVLDVGVGGFGVRQFFYGWVLGGRR
jgi:hypothetical protein